MSGGSPGGVRKEGRKGMEEISRREEEIQKGNEDLGRGRNDEEGRWNEQSGWRLGEIRT